ncbi:MAG: hypothetical protein GKS03_00505 [Alphaproteobacteria bacterium]|nr:hypothetical protein [Alphaproteobacteria bacterium]
MEKREVHSFHKDGFILAKNALSEDTLSKVSTYFCMRLDQLALHLGYAFSSQGLNLNQKTIELESAHPGAMLTLTHSQQLSAQLVSMATDENILAAVKELLGSDVDLHPFYAIRPKPPAVQLFEVPWHQDSSYLQKGADQTPQITFWVPLMDSTVENGCLEVAVGEHNSGELKHEPHSLEEYGNSSWYLEIPSDVASSFQRQAFEIGSGSYLIFSHLTPHRSLPNRSENSRWSIDFRFARAGYFNGANSQSLPVLRKGELTQDVRDFTDAEMTGSAEPRSWVTRIERPVWVDRWR